VVVVRGRRAVAVGRFLIVPPAGKSLSKPPPKPPLSLRHPELEEDLEEREKDRRRLKPGRSRVPTGVTPLLLRSTTASTSMERLSSLAFPLLLDWDMSDSIPLDNALAKLLFSEEGVRA